MSTETSASTTLPRRSRRWDVFISHASEDVEAARGVCAALENSGWSVFLAARDLPGQLESADWSQRIDEALDDSGLLVLLASPEALSKRWVTYEWRSIHDDVLADRGGWIVPCCIRDVAPDGLGRALRRYQVVDLRAPTQWDAGFTTLLSLIEGYLKRPIRTVQSVTRRVLTIQGAGARTTVAAEILKALERVVGPLREHFDLIVANSFGAVLAARLGQGATSNDAAAAVAYVLEQSMRGPSMFRTLSFRSRHSTDKLRRALSDIFGDASVESVPKCAISTFDLVSGEHRLWSSSKVLNGGNGDALVADVVAGAIAAPVYFDPVEIAFNTDQKKVALIDGSLWAVDPARVGLEAVRRMFSPTPLISDIVLVAVGSGGLKVTPMPDYTRANLLRWISPVIEILLNANRDSSHEHVLALYRQAGALQNYVRLDPALPANENWPVDVLNELPRFGQFGTAWASSRQDLLQQAAELLR